MSENRIEHNWTGMQNLKSGSLLFEPQKWITSDLTSEGLGEMFECDSADTCAEKFPLVSMGGRAEGLACAEPGARTPIGASGNLYNFIQVCKFY